MDTKVNKTVRQLARDYYDGRLDFAEYRHKRRRVIDEITDSDKTQPLGRVAEVDSVATEPAEVVTAERQTQSKNRYLLPLIGMVILGVMAAWLLLPIDKKQDGEFARSDVGRPVSTETMPDSVASDTVIDQFLASGDWSYAALTDLTLAWSALQAEEQQVIRATPGFRDIAGQLRNLLVEARAMEEIEGDVTDKAGILVSLADHLGIAVSKSAGVTRKEAVSEPVEAVTEEAEKPEVDDLANEAGSAVAEVPAEDALNGVALSKVVQETTETEPAVVDTTPTPAAGNSAVPEAIPEEVAAKPAPEEQPVAEASQEKKTVSRPAPASKGDTCAAELAKTRRPYCKDALADGTAGPIMVVLPAGSFRMGSEREASEQPVHKVNISRSFAVSAYEISVSDYQRFCQASGRHCAAAWKGARDPMVNVSWKDARSYTNWLSKQTGMSYRLPTEAEWEYAARGGTTTDYPFAEGDKVLPSDARFEAQRPLPVDDRSVNVSRFKLRHIVGNVREWVEDAWFGDYKSVPKDGSARTSAATNQRVVRGGSFADPAYLLRSASRIGLSSDTRDSQTGFRIVREINN